MATTEAQSQICSCEGFDGPHTLFPHSLFSSILVFLGPGFLFQFQNLKKKITTIAWYVFVLQLPQILCRTDQRQIILKIGPCEYLEN